MAHKPNYTVRYSIVHGCFWPCLCPIFSFAAVYLQLKGYGAAKTGVLLSLIAIVSALIQPFLAAQADRSRRVSLRGYLILISTLSMFFIAAMLVPRLSGGALLLAFFAASVLLHLLEPLLNSVANYCMVRQIPLNFGAARAIGTLCFALTSYGLGYAADRFGADSLMLVSAVFLFLLILSYFLLPPMEPGLSARGAQTEQPPCSLPRFFKTYRRYTLVLLGFFFISVFHTMTETYLINMMELIGGSSKSVGTALLLANICEFVAIFFYERFRRLLSSAGWLKVTVVCFVVKALLFYLAPSVPFMYLAQMLQAFTFGLYAPTIVFFSSEEIAKPDMVKGQTICVAFFTMGSSLGNLLGGLLIERVSVPAMTFTGFLSACVGAVIVILVLHKKRSTLRQTA